MRRWVLVVVALSAFVPSTGAHAGVTSNPNAAQQWGFFWGGSLPTGGYRQVYLNVTNSVGAVIAGSTVTPSTDFHASGADTECSSTFVCTTTAFDQQQIAPTAFQADPIGNSLRFTACLLPQGGGGCRNFDLSAVRPSYLSQCATCVIPNAWFDPNTNQAGATIYSFLGISRFGYTITGTFNGSLLPPILPGQAMDNFNEYLFATTAVVAP